MHLDNQIKLDFKDVLIRPKRSTLTSRSQVDITREIKFRWSPERFHAIPVIAANMDTTGTFEMARALGRHGMMTALHKHYSAQEYIDFFTGLENKSDAFYSLGIGDAEYEQFCAVMKAAPGAVRYVCIDVANGYTEAFGMASCAVSRMKAHWFYLIHRFAGSEKLEKQLRKVREPWEYEVVVNQIFTLPFRP